MDNPRIDGDKLQSDEIEAEDINDEHLEFTIDEWKLDVVDGRTTFGYREWVMYRIGLSRQD